MKNSFLNIVSEKTSGFCNQMYSILYTCGQAYKNKHPNFIFLGKFLREINSDNFCNISEIIDLDSTNQHLKQFNICLVDYYNFDFKIVSACYGINNMCVDVTSQIRFFLKDKIFRVTRDLDLNSLVVNPVDFYKNNFGINLNPDNLRLYITYSNNNTIFQEIYEQTNGHLTQEILIDLKNPEFKPPVLIQNDQSEFCKAFIRNTVYKPHFSEKAREFVDKNLRKDKKINCIHLRLEDDAISHWANINKMTKETFKEIMEDKYIFEIKSRIEKEDNIVILASNYDNNVIQFLKENGYNYILTPKMDKCRDVAAIYDLHIGQYCNNVYILTYDSSFSYTLWYRIYEQDKVIPIVLHLDFEVEKNMKAVHQ